MRDAVVVRKFGEAWNRSEAARVLWPAQAMWVSAVRRSLRHRERAAG